MIELALLVVILVALALAGPLLGVDSRATEDRHHPGSWVALT